MYDNAEYANSRLLGTIVRTMQGRPVTIHSCEPVRDDDISVTYRSLSTERRGQCLLSELDLTPVPLGFANNSGMDCSYLARMPMRNDYRQGLRAHNYVSLWGPDKRYVETPVLSRLIQGNYFDLDGAMEVSFNSMKATPFSREFAVGECKGKSEAKLYYKWYGVVGDIINDRVNLYDKFDYLEESLEGAL